MQSQEILEETNRQLQAIKLAGKKPIITFELLKELDDIHDRLALGLALTEDLKRLYHATQSLIREVEALEIKNDGLVREIILSHFPRPTLRIG